MSIKKIPFEESKQEDGSVLFDHPSYGVISRTRETLANPVTLFGMDTVVKDVVTMKIKGVTLKESLGDSFYIENQTHVEIMMAASQFVDAFTNMNSSGVPCSIVETVSKGRIKLASTPTNADFIIDSIINNIDECVSSSNQLVSEVESLISKTGTINKTDRDEAASKVFEYSRKLYDSLPHNIKCYSDAADKQVMEAKATIDLAITNKKDKIIKRILSENPEILSISKD